MNTQNTHTTNQANQIKFDSFGLLLADFWLTVCGAHSQYYKVQLSYAPHGCTKTQLSCERFVSGGAGIQLSYVSSLFQNLKSNIQNLNKLKNIILFNHSFGGLSPPKAARV